MNELSLIIHLLFHHLERRLPSSPPARHLRSQRGAVSLEQVLWFVAAGVSVAVVAGIIWAQIMSQASSPINAPSAP